MLEKLWPLCVLAAASSLVYILHTRLFWSSIATVPGPGYSKVTEIWLMLQEFTGRRRLYIHDLHKRYGPVVRLGPNEVSFTSLEAIKEIYTSGGSGYDRTELYNLFKQFGARTMFSTLPKGDHSQKKRYIAGQYANTNIMHPDVLGGIENRVKAFIQKCVEFSEKSVDVYVYLHCFALDCATHHLFYPYSTHSIEDEKDFKLMQELSYHDSLKLFLIQYRFSTLVNILLKITRARPAPLSREYVFSIVPKSDLGEHTLLHKLQKSKDFFKPVDMAAECMDHMAAGIDTTGDALTFLMYEISLPSNIHIQQALFDEFRRTPSSSLDEFEYLDAVVKEGLRCFPPIPMSQPRYVPEGGKMIDGYYIPGGTIVSCQAYSVHRLNEDVFPEGDKFWPERWLDSERSVGMNKLFFAFGTGGRGCTGRHLAMAEMKILLKEVYSHFRTRIADDMKGRMDISDQIISSRPLDQTCKLVFEPL